jgi:hypothetical protein
MGPAGPAGRDGYNGRDGKDGASLKANYAVYVSKECQTITRGGHVFFNGDLINAGEPVGFSLPINGGSDIRIREDGIYHISYSLLTTKAVGATISLLINGLAHPLTRDTLTRDADRVVRFATLSLRTNDVLAIGVENEPITLHATENNAVIDIFKIAEIR